jgi:preprotein translocase subunit SecG
MSILINVILAVWCMVALLMILVILMQRPKSEGLGAAFGGGVTENIFGAQTTNVLVKFTGWLAGIFFVLTFTLSVLYANRSRGDSSFRRELLKTQAATPQASPAAGAVQSSPSVPGPEAAAAGLGIPPAAADGASPSSAAGAAAGVVPPASVPVAPSPAATTSPPKP